MNAARPHATSEPDSPPFGGWLEPLTGNWVDAARSRLAQWPTVVRVTVAALRGSAPREPGATMLVDASGTTGTIGGGQLEWQAMRAAREVLLDPRLGPVRIDERILGTDLGQCCGGRVELWLERLSRSDLPWLQDLSHACREAGGASLSSELRGGIAIHRVRRGTLANSALEWRRGDGRSPTLIESFAPARAPLWIFGAGHVGQALVRLLGSLALFDVQWIESRPELLPAELPGCVTATAAGCPVDRVPNAPPATRFVVLTHDHALDYALCRAVLDRGDAAWLGLIGSSSKAARFRSRLRRDGVSAGRLALLTCPIGIHGISSKLPAAIAIAIAAQLLQQAAHPPGGAARDVVAGGGDCGQACTSCGPQSRPHT